MKAWELLKVLDEGNIIRKIYHNDPECVKTCKLEKFQRSCNCCENKVVFKYYFGGWGSYGLANLHLMEIIENPEEWEVLK